MDQQKAMSIFRPLFCTHTNTGLVTHSVGGKVAAVSWEDFDQGGVMVGNNPIPWRGIFFFLLISLFPRWTFLGVSCCKGAREEIALDFPAGRLDPSRAATAAKPSLSPPVASPGGQNAAPVPPGGRSNRGVAASLPFPSPVLKLQHFPPPGRGSTAASPGSPEGTLHFQASTGAPQQQNSNSRGSPAIFSAPFPRCCPTPSFIPLIPGLGWAAREGKWPPALPSPTGLQSFPQPRRGKRIWTGKEGGWLPLCSGIALRRENLLCFTARSYACLL